MTAKNAYGLTRQSRGDDGSMSPAEQRKAQEAWCEREGYQLVETGEELDVSGRRPLSRRPGLLRGIELVEAGAVQVIVSAYFDRLVRNLDVQRQAIDRVEAAGGGIVAIDHGKISNGTAAQWLTSTTLGMISEYYSRSTGERTLEAKRDMVMRGVPPYPHVPPGLRKNETTRVLEHDPANAEIVREAFRLRDGGASVREVRDFLRSHGIKRTKTGTQAMLSSRLYLGELRFGDWVNPTACEPLIDPALWRRVQGKTAIAGRKGKSERLLARQGILRCGSCGSRMVVGGRGKHDNRYEFYRCSPHGDCARRVAISAAIVEDAVAAETQRLLAGVHGSASLAGQVADAERFLVDAEEALNAAVEAFDGLQDVAKVREKLHELRGSRDAAEQKLAELRATIGPTVTLSIEDWDMLSLEGRRRLIRLAIDRVEISPGGKGAERITIVPRGQTRS